MTGRQLAGGPAAGKVSPQNLVFGDGHLEHGPRFRRDPRPSSGYDRTPVVLVVTHRLTYLDVCGQVVFLAPGGKTAYCGPAADIRRPPWTARIGPTCSRRSPPTPTRPTATS